MLHIIGGKFKNRRLHSPKGDCTRPTSALLRGAVFNMLQGSIENARFLDVCAGTGAMGLEALSRGASEAVFIEKDRHASQCIKSNLTELQEDKHAVVYGADALAILKKLSEKNERFHVIYIDPPYEAKVHLSNRSVSLAAALLEAIDSSKLLDKEGYLFIEEAVEQSDLSIASLRNLQSEGHRKYGRSKLSVFRYPPLIKET